MVKDRIVKFLETNKISKRGFANAIGRSNSYVNNIVNTISVDALNAIKVAYPDLNTDWLLTGEGEMLKSQNQTNVKYIAPYLGEDSVNVPHVTQRAIRYWTDVDVAGGTEKLFEDTLTDNYEDMVIPEFRDCTDAVNLYGDSMSPRYNPGQIVILKEWTDPFIAFGQVYLVITKSGFRTVKYLRKGDKSSEVLCVSENPKYDPFTIGLEDILKMYLVKGVIEKTTL